MTTGAERDEILKQVYRMVALERVRKANKSTKIKKRVKPIKQVK